MLHNQLEGKKLIEMFHKSAKQHMFSTYICSFLINIPKVEKMGF